MKKFLIYFLMTFCFSAFNIYSQSSTDSEYTLNSGAENYVEEGAEFCADYILVNAGASYITDVEDGTCSGANISGDGYIELPVELIFFTGVVIENKVSLKWSTATETNNRGFSVERKFPLVQNEEWREVGFVEGYGSTTETQEYQFIDTPEINGKILYRLKQMDFNGSFEYSPEIEVEYETELPKDFKLFQNYPNPFSKGSGGNPATTIKYTIPSSGNNETIKVKLIVYDALGAEVSTLVNENQSAGRYEAIWNAENFPSGIYFYSLQAGGFYKVKKMSLIK